MTESEAEYLSEENEEFKKEIGELLAHNKDLIAEHSDFLFGLSEKAPHLMGCAKTVAGGWICDERCLVTRVEVQKHNIEVLLAENRDLEERLKEALLNVAQHLR